MLEGLVRDETVRQRRRELQSSGPGIDQNASLEFGGRK